MGYPARPARSKSCFSLKNGFCLASCILPQPAARSCTAGWPGLSNIGYSERPLIQEFFAGQLFKEQPLDKFETARAAVRII
jgi:hypothetical protein